MRRIKCLFVIITAGLMVAGAARHAQADQDIIPVNENAYGNTYGEWSAQWWQWALSIPAANSPISDAMA